MADLGFLTEFMVPVIVGICLCVGYVIKKWIIRTLITSGFLLYAPFWALY